ncbi:MAG: hypothetical protein U0800_13425 [Isosphaeraceae bacterium]
MNAPARAIHLLSGVGGWSYPASEEGTTSMIVRIRYADGKTEDHKLLNGVTSPTTSAAWTSPARPSPSRSRASGSATSP